MSVNVAKEVAALGRMTVKELRSRFAEAFGEATNAANKAWLVKRIAWRMQAMAEGGLSERARQRAAELANDADLRLTPPKAMPVTNATPVSTATGAMSIQGNGRLPIAGSIICRAYKGRDLQVRVLSKGFEFEGEVYKSLSAVAKKITGQHLNGYLFFRLRKEAVR